MFTAMAANFVPLLAPTNQMSYDTEQFYNSALAIVAGVGAAALSFRLMPPLSPAFRTRRLLALTLRDLRRLATGPIPRTPDDWEGRMYGRLAALPDRAEPLQRSQLLAAFSVGTEIIQLRRIAQRLDLRSELDAALEAIARGDSALATARLAALDETLAARPGAAALRARGSILAMSEALTQHAVYFDAGALRVRFTEINLFGVYVAPMSLMMVAAWVVDDRTAAVRRPFRPVAIRSSRATTSAPRCGSEGVDAVLYINPALSAPNASREYSGDCLITARFCGDRRSYHGGSNVEWQLPAPLARCHASLRSLLTKRQRAFSRGSGNRSSCPTLAVRGARRRRLNWVKRLRTIRNRSRYIPAARTVNTPSVADFS